MRKHLKIVQKCLCVRFLQDEFNYITKVWAVLCGLWTLELAGQHVSANFCCVFVSRICILKLNLLFFLYFLRSRRSYGHGQIDSAIDSDQGYMYILYIVGNAFVPVTYF